jgi:hypothetical protein
MPYPATLLTDNTWFWCIWGFSVFRATAASEIQWMAAAEKLVNESGNGFQCRVANYFRDKNWI